MELFHQQLVVGTPLDLLRERLEIGVFRLVLEIPVLLHHPLALLQNGVLKRALMK